MTEHRRLCNRTRNKTQAVSLPVKVRPDDKEKSQKHHDCVGKNAREEEEMWRNIRRDPAAYSQLPEDDQLTLMFNICTTKKGSVYHSFPTCGYLQAVQAGPRRESRWCPLCRYVARHGRGRPPPGVSVWMSGLGGIA
jgi:hypothetical protein